MMGFDDRFDEVEEFLVENSMIQIIVHTFIENGVFEVVFDSENSQVISENMAELQNQFPNDYLAIYDLPLNTDLSILVHYPSVAIGKEDFLK